MLNALFLIILMSVLAWACLSILDIDQLQWLRDDAQFLGLVGAVFIVSLLAVAFCGLKYFGPSDLGRTEWLICGFFLMTIWSSSIDTGLSLSLVNWSSLGAYYHQNGERYFQTAWGFAALLWDGTGHWLLQALAVVGLMRKEFPLAVCLVWCGSIVNSMPVLLLGAATGSYSGEIQLSTALNAPYLLVPLAICAYALTTASPRVPPVPTPLPKIARFIEFCFSVLYFSAIIIHTLRAMVVLGSRSALATQWLQQVEPVLAEPTGFARIQVLVNFFLLGSWELFSMVEAFRRAITATVSEWPLSSDKFDRLALIFLGVALQAHVCWIVMVLCRWESFTLVDSGFTTLSSVQLTVLGLLYPLLRTCQTYSRVHTTPEPKKKQ